MLSGDFPVTGFLYLVFAQGCFFLNSTEPVTLLAYQPSAQSERLMSGHDILRMRKQFCDVTKLHVAQFLWVMWFSLLPITLRLEGVDCSSSLIAGRA